MNTSFNTKKWVLPFLGFSLVEVLAAVAIIGIITFLAMPNIIAVKQDSETVSYTHLTLPTKRIV